MMQSLHLNTYAEVDMFQRIKLEVCLHQNHLLSTHPLQKYDLKAGPNALTENSTHTGPV